MGRKKPRDINAQNEQRRGKRRSIRYDAELVDPTERRRQIRKDAPPTIHLRRLPAENALGRLKAMLLGYARLGRREVIVVHGRGHNSPGGQPILGPLVRRWCDEHPELVSSWREAPPEWGGAGAIVVALR
jgi:DNA-nicking Smr family endonuclease